MIIIERLLFLFFVALFINIKVEFKLDTEKQCTLFISRNSIETRVCHIIDELYIMKIIYIFIET